MSAPMSTVLTERVGTTLVGTPDRADAGQRPMDLAMIDFMTSLVPP